MLGIFQTFIDSWQRELTSPLIGAGSPLRAPPPICIQHYSALSRHSRPSQMPSQFPTGNHSVTMSIRLTKKPLVSVPGSHSPWPGESQNVKRVARDHSSLEARGPMSVTK
jgi:hypothetical protein